MIVSSLKQFHHISLLCLFTFDPTAFAAVFFKGGKVLKNTVTI